MKLDFVALNSAIANDLSMAFNAAGQSEPIGQFMLYLNQQQAAIRYCIVALYEKQPIGYVTICWPSSTQNSIMQNIPIVKDLNVLPQYRRRGVGTALLKVIEAKAAESFDRIGLYAEITEESLGSRILYEKLGYIKFIEEPIMYVSELNYEGAPPARRMYVYFYIKRLDKHNA